MAGRHLRLKWSYIARKVNKCKISSLSFGMWAHPRSNRAVPTHSALFCFVLLQPEQDYFSYIPLSPVLLFRTLFAPVSGTFSPPRYDFHPLCNTPLLNWSPQYISSHHDRNLSISIKKGHPPTFSDFPGEGFKTSLWVSFARDVVPEIIYTFWICYHSTLHCFLNITSCFPSHLLNGVGSYLPSWLHFLDVENPLLETLSFAILSFPSFHPSSQTFPTT